MSLSQKRDAALKLQLPVLSPFADFGYRVEWQSGIARIWLWNEKKRAELAAEQTFTGEVVVESAFTPAEEGLTLYQCQRGFMVQQWRDGQLLLDSWWETLPGQAAWQQFLRATESADYSENSEATSALSVKGHTPDQDTANALPVTGHTPRTAAGTMLCGPERRESSSQCVWY